MSRILVTGGAGFVGSFLLDRLVKQGYCVSVYDNLDSQVHPQGKKPAYLNKEAQLIKKDIRDYNSLKTALKKVDVVFHLAAAVGVGQSQYQIKHYVDVNIGGTANLLDIIINSRNKVKKVIVASSMSIYGEGPYKCKRCGMVNIEVRKQKDLNVQRWEPRCAHCQKVLLACPTKEEHRLASTSIYAITKKAQEEMVLNIGKTYGIPAVALRFFNIYGPRQALSNPYTGVMAIFMSRIKNNNPPIIYEDGNQSRDFISVHDIVEACILAMKKEKADFTALNVGKGEPLTIKEMAERLIRLSGEKIKPVILEKFRKGDIRHCYADISKINSLLGFRPKIEIEEGMRELMKWSTSIKAEDKFSQAQRQLKIKKLV